MGTTSTGYRDTWLWNFGLSAYWFAQSYKWFILLLAVLPGQVEAVVPGGAKNTYWGMVFAIGAAWAVIGPAIFGSLSDRMGRRQPWIAAGAGLTVLALAFLAGADSLWMLVLGYLLLQLSDDVGTGPYAGLIPQIVPVERRGRASSVMSMLQLSGQIVTAVVGLALGSYVLIYVGVAVVNVVCAVVTLVTIRGVPALPPVARRGGFFAGFARPWRVPDFRWVWFTRFLAALALYLIQPYLRFFLTDEVAGTVRDGVKVFALFGRTVGDAGQAVIVLALTISVVGVLGSMVAARYSDKWGRKRLIRISGTIIALVLVPFALSRDYTTIWMLSVLLGGAYGTYLSADWALASDVMPDPATSGNDMGVWTSSVTSVQLFAGGAGVLIDMGNRVSKGMGYTGAILTAAVLYFLVTVFVLRVRGSS